MTAPEWRQITIAFPDPHAAEQAASTHLAPILADAEARQLITTWFYVRKGDWRLRYLTAATIDADRYVTGELERLTYDGRICGALPGIYEPETCAFGGSAAMDIAHQLWHYDSRHLLTHDNGGTATRERETSIMLSAAMMRAAALDWYEQGDVWARVAGHRDPAKPDRVDSLLNAARRLLTVDPDVLTQEEAPLAGYDTVIEAYTSAGDALRHLNQTGQLHRGLRATLAHHVIFAWNRRGIPGLQQAALATAAKTVVFGPDPTLGALIPGGALMNPTVARRFPLVARPRPACTPLIQRVSDLQERADLAHERRDVASATAVFNLAALLASDCGLPDLARTWCHRLAAVALAHDSDPQHALEPIVNLARLHVRAGDGPAAWTLLEKLFQAIDTRTDITIDGLTIPAALLTDTPEAHRKARTWLWTVLLGTGAHALATAGQWNEASQHLSRYKGVGARMLDGRQVTVIAHAMAGRNHQARAMLGTTQPGEPWENSVTACLSLHVPTDDPADLVTAALTAYHALGPAESGLAVFHIRLGLTVIDALDSGHPAREQIAVNLIRYAASDGYAARDLLAHPGRLGIATSRQIGQLTELVSDCGLSLGNMSAAHLASLNGALDTAESVIACQKRRQAHLPV